MPEWECTEEKRYEIRKNTENYLHLFKQYASEQRKTNERKPAALMRIFQEAIVATEEIVPSGVR